MLLASSLLPPLARAIYIYCAFLFREHSTLFVYVKSLFGLWDSIWLGTAAAISVLNGQGVKRISSILKLLLKSTVRV